MKTYRNQVSGVAAVALFLLAVLFVAAVVGLQAWILMLLLGAAHHEISDSVPALGFLGSIIAVLLLNTVGGLLRGSSGDRK